MKTRLFTTVALVLGLSSILGGACFSLKEPPCAFTCLQPPHACPAQYSCGADGLCHRQGVTATCALRATADGGVDLGHLSGDAARDGDPASDSAVPDAALQSDGGLGDTTGDATGGPGG